MANAIILTMMVNGYPRLPDMEALQWMDGKTLRGGWSLVGEPRRKSQLVMVETSDATLAAIAADPAYKVVETMAADMATPRAAPVAKKDADALVAWLTTANAAPVEAKAMPTMDKLIDAVCELHGVKRVEEYNAACAVKGVAVEEKPSVVIVPDEPKPQKTRPVRSWAEYCEKYHLPVDISDDDFATWSENHIPGDTGPLETRTMTDTAAALPRDVKLTMPKKRSRK